MQPKIEFLESPMFTTWVAETLTDEEYVSLQFALVANPEAGDIIPGTGGFRKLRWADASSATGKRGGFRVIYYYFDNNGLIYFVAAYSKALKTDLSAAEKKALRGMAAAEKKTRRV